MNIKEIKNLLFQQKIFPSRRLGQNFLTSENILQKIIEISNISKKDLVLEVGAGIGNLTFELAKKAKRVIAVEKDPKMIEILKEVLKDFKNVEIIKEDILKIEITPLQKQSFLRGSPVASPILLRGKNLKLKDYKVVANIPYYLTSPLIRKFLEAKNKPKEMVLMVQKEVAQRICAVSKMSILALSVQFYAKPEIIFFVSKKSFWPEPKVDSAVLKIIPRRFYQPISPIFFKIVKIGFSHPRKQLVNNLSKGLQWNKERIKNWLLKNNINPKIRAEDLKIENWLKLTKDWLKNNY